MGGEGNIDAVSKDTAGEGGDDRDKFVGGLDGCGGGAYRDDVLLVS